MKKLILLICFFGITYSYSQNKVEQSNFCKIATENGKASSKHFQKSYFTHDDNNTLIQVMYLSELAADSNQDYSIMSKESKETGYVDKLAEMILKTYKSNDYEFSNTLKSYGFTHFQVIQIDNNNLKNKSKRYNIN